MATTDAVLGYEVHDHLVELGIETPMDKMSPENIKANGGVLQNIHKAHAITMQVLGLDLKDDSLHETPNRVAKMYCQEIFTGLEYENFPKCSTFDNKMKMDEMVLVKGADVLSVCEHHFVAFIGKAHVAYIPNTKVLGLSKFHRVVDFFSRRPQVQERLTLQIYEALKYILKTDDIAVVIEAEHLCVRLRGVKQDSTTITSKMGGKFMDKPALREEFLALAKG